MSRLSSIGPLRMRRPVCLRCLMRPYQAYRVFPGFLTGTLGNHSKETILLYRLQYKDKMPYRKITIGIFAGYHSHGYRRYLVVDWALGL